MAVSVDHLELLRLPHSILGLASKTAIVGLATSCLWLWPLAEALGQPTDWPEQPLRLFDRLSTLDLKTSGQWIQIVNGQIVLGAQLQDQLYGEIDRAKGKLVAVGQQLSLQFSSTIGLTYTHKGGDDWSLRFTFGGLPLKTEDEMIVSTREIFQLRQAFRQTPWLAINGQRYVTTRWMRQLGPVLHTPRPKT